MKKPIVIEILIWILILLLISGGLFFAYYKFLVQPNVYYIKFKDIDGITKGSPVRFMGINVGYVRKLLPEEKQVNVQIILTKKNMEIPNGTSARVEFYGLGGSKSIELMPPDDSCSVGILTTDTIRINDVARETVSIVEIIEGLEKYVSGLNKYSLQNIFETIKSTKDDEIKSFGNDISNMEENISSKLDKIKTKQDEMTQKIEKVNENVEKINEFIKK